MKPFTLLKSLLGLAFVGAAFAARLAPQAIETTIAESVSSNRGFNKHYTIVPDSIYDGDTFRVSNGSQEIKVRLCGIDSPEIEQSFGIESRDRLRSLITQGNGQVILVETDPDQYGRTIAEAFIPLEGSEEDIHLNSQLVADGMAYIYPPYVDSCPNAQVIKQVEQNAKEQSLGVWADKTAEKPWDYRRRS